MADASLSTTVPLGKWVDTLLHNIFFQPHDSLSTNTYEQYVSPNLVVKINHDQIEATTYQAAVQQAREKQFLILDSNTELQCWNAPDGSGSGCVAHMTKFTQKDKESGEEVKASSLILANVQVRDGKRVLVELTEIVN